MPKRLIHSEKLGLHYEEDSPESNIKKLPKKNSKTQNKPESDQVLTQTQKSDNQNSNNLVSQLLENAMSAFGKKEQKYLVNQYKSYVKDRLDKYGEKDEENEKLSKGLSFLVPNWMKDKNKNNSTPKELRKNHIYYHLNKKDSRLLFLGNHREWGNLRAMYEDVRLELIDKNEIQNFMTGSNQPADHEIHVKNPDFKIFVKLDEDYYYVFYLHSQLMRFHGFNQFDDYVFFNFHDLSAEKKTKEINPNSFAAFSLRLYPNLTQQISFVENFIKWLYSGIFNFDSRPGENDLLLAKKFGLEFNLNYFVRTIKEEERKLDENQEGYELLIRKGQKREFEKMDPMQRMKYVVSRFGNQEIMEKFDH